MPTYTFYDKDTDEQFDEFMSWSEREKYLKDNPNIEFNLITNSNSLPKIDNLNIL